MDILLVNKWFVLFMKLLRLLQKIFTKVVSYSFTVGTSVPSYYVTDHSKQLMWSVVIKSYRIFSKIIEEFYSCSIKKNYLFFV